MYPSVDLVGLLRQIFVDTRKYVELLGKFDESFDRTGDACESLTPRSQPTMLIWGLVFLYSFKVYFRKKKSCPTSEGAVVSSSCFDDVFLQSFYD